MLIKEAKPSTGMGSECQQDGTATARARLDHVIEHAEDKTENLHLIRKARGRTGDASQGEQRG